MTMKTQLYKICGIQQKLFCGELHNYIDLPQKKQEKSQAI